MSIFRKRPPPPPPLQEDMFHSQYDTQHARPKTLRGQSRFSSVEQAQGRAPAKGLSTSRSSSRQTDVTGAKQRPSISQRSYSESIASQKRSKPVIKQQRMSKEKPVITKPKVTQKGVSDHVPNKYSTNEIPVHIRKVKQQLTVPVLNTDPVPVAKPTQPVQSKPERRTQKSVVQIINKQNAKPPAKQTSQSEATSLEHLAPEGGFATEAIAEGAHGNAASESAANTEEAVNSEVTLDTWVLLGDPSVAHIVPNEHGTNDHSHSVPEHTHIAAGTNEHAQATSGTQEHTPSLPTPNGKTRSGTTQRQSIKDTRSKKSSNTNINIPANVRPDKFEAQFMTMFDAWYGMKFGKSPRTQAPTTAAPTTAAPTTGAPTRHLSQPRTRTGLPVKMVPAVRNPNVKVMDIRDQILRSKGAIARSGRRVPSRMRHGPQSARSSDNGRPRNPSGRHSPAVSTRARPSSVKPNRARPLSAISSRSGPSQALPSRARPSPAGQIRPRPDSSASRSRDPATRSRQPAAVSRTSSMVPSSSRRPGALKRSRASPTVATRSHQSSATPTRAGPQQPTPTRTRFYSATTLRPNHSPSAPSRSRQPAGRPEKLPMDKKALFADFMKMFHKQSPGGAAQPTASGTKATTPAHTHTELPAHANGEAAAGGGTPNAGGANVEIVPSETPAVPLTTARKSIPRRTTTIRPVIDPDMLADINEARVTQGLPQVQAYQVDLLGNVLPFYKRQLMTGRLPARMHPLLNPMPQLNMGNLGGNMGTNNLDFHHQAIHLEAGNNMSPNLHRQIHILLRNRMRNNQRNNIFAAMPSPSYTRAPIFDPDMMADIMEAAQAARLRGRR